MSVVLCTFNRSTLLSRALRGLAAQQSCDAFEWEVLVVDNNSSDGTREVAQEVCLRHPGRFRYCFEQRSGKSHALNTGVREARGKILAFVDDDVTVEATWLSNLVAPLLSGSWAGCGGRILPERGFSPPRWLPLERRYALGPLAVFDLGGESHELTESPFGTNMAFRREVFDAIGGFRTDLGPRPGSEIRDEDTEFGRRALAAGMRLWYEPSAIVYHSVPRRRLTKRYFRRWWFDKGRAEVRQSGIRPGTKYYGGGVPLYLFRQLAVWILRWMAAVRPSLRFSREVTVCRKVGEIVECRRMRRFASERRA